MFQSFVVLSIVFTTNVISLSTAVDPFSAFDCFSWRMSQWALTDACPMENLCCVESFLCEIDEIKLYLFVLIYWCFCLFAEKLTKANCHALSAHACIVSLWLYCINNDMEMYRLSMSWCDVLLVGLVPSTSSCGSNWASTLFTFDNNRLWTFQSGCFRSKLFTLCWLQ